MTTGSSVFSGGNPLNAAITLFLVQLVVVVLSRTLARIFRIIKQPSVVAEVVAGILLGPSALGKIPGFTRWIFPPTTHDLDCAYPPMPPGSHDAEVLPPYGPVDVLSIFANFGLVLFMFIIGLELDIGIMRKNLKEGLVISISCMILPFVLGAGAGKLVWDTVGKQETTNVYIFVVFVSVAMSITAFPVLARILSESKILDSRVGNLSLSAAALNDVLAWILLAVVVSIANAQSILTSLWTFLSLLGFVVFMLVVVKPLLTALAKSRYFNSEEGEISLDFVAIFLIAIFICAWFTEIIGVDVIFGGFIMGLTIPRVNHLPERFVKSIEDVVLVLLLPLYFTNSGLKTNIGTLSHSISWLMVLLVIGAASVGKIVAGTLSSKLIARTNWKESLTIGFLMNTKGLVELIVLNVGLQAGVLNTEVFTIFVLMALVTTFVTSPAIHFLYVSRSRNRTKLESDYSVLVIVKNIQAASWACEIFPTLLAKNEAEVKVYLVKSISDRPSSYMKSEFGKLFGGLSFRKKAETEVIRKSRMVQKTEKMGIDVEQDPLLLDNEMIPLRQVVPRVLATARPNADIIAKATSRFKDLVILELKLEAMDDMDSQGQQRDTRSTGSTFMVLNQIPSPTGVFVHKTSIPTRAKEIVFLYEGREFEYFALEFVRNLQSQNLNNPFLKITVISKIGLEWEIPSNLIVSNDLVDEFIMMEENVDLLIMGSQRTTHFDFRSPEVKYSRVPLLLLFPSYVASNDVIDDVV